MKVVFIVIDTLRADHLGCYGYDLNTSPNIDKIAREGVLFERAYATDVPTQPSYTSMFTGQRGVKTGIVSHSPTEDLSPNVPYLSEILASHGYLTAAVSTLYMMRRWFARGFHYYMNPYAGKPRQLLQQVDADDINAMAIPWIRQNADKDFFIFIHYWDPHGIYMPPPKEYRYLFYRGKDPTDPNNHSLDRLKKSVLWPFYKRHLDRIREANNLAGEITDIEFVKAQYDGEIKYVDDKIGELVQLLEELGIIDETLLIITADHGESLGEHEEYFDHATVYEPVIHVPLIIRYHELPKGKRVKDLVQLIDLPYTILKLAGIPIPKEFEGRDLVPIANGEASGYDEVYSNQGLWTAKRAVITKDGWKLIKTIDPGFWECPPLELYNLVKDPSETKNLVYEEEDIVDELELKMVRWLEKELGNRPDPLRLISAAGLPPKEWVKRAAEEYIKGGGTYEEVRMKMGF
ncbi:MAG: sulfatase [Thermoprotei archaeon]|nr:sulfatase [Thermoprotei archaeon]